MTLPDTVESRLSALREAFDGSFAKAAGAERPEQLDFLALRIAGDPYAVRLSEVQSLHASRKLVAAPSRLPELLGVAGFRGVLTPIYDLGRLLGYAGESSAKWLVVAEGPSPVGFAFAVFDAHLRVPLERVSPAQAGTAAAIRGAVQLDGSVLPLLHLPSIIEGIAQRIKTLGSSQER
ncbi:MAG: chemotaxis protein CheW [Polyangiaceae bacterium]